MYDKKVLRIKARAVEVTLGLPKFRKGYGNGGLILTTSKVQIFTSREVKQRRELTTTGRAWCDESCKPWFGGKTVISLK